MANTCENCAHWVPSDAKGTVRNGLVGECRYGPPTASYAWPKTRPEGYCGCHQARASQEAPAAKRGKRTTDQLTLG